jgi:DNA-binding MarR family transcriptional regulator
MSVTAETGLVVEQPDPSDRRVMRYVLPDSGGEKFQHRERR